MSGTGSQAIGCSQAASPSSNEAVGVGELAEIVGHRPGQVLVDLAAGRRPEEEGDADVDGAGRQRGDDRLDAAVDDDAAVDEAAGRAGGEADDDAERDLERASR